MRLWQQWLREDARHHAAYVRLERGWRQADCLQSLKPLDGTVSPDLLDTFPGLQPRSRSRRRVRPGACVALVAGALASLGALAGGLSLMKPDQEIHQTERGGFERVVLPDGSTASLNTNSEIRIHFTRSLREIVLIRGEALFAVVRDARPFEVEAGDNAVRTSGTSFAVRLQTAGRVEVLVVRGEVAVARPQAIGAGFLFSSGDDAVIDARGHAERVNPPDIARKLAWARGQSWAQQSRVAEVPP